MINRRVLVLNQDYNPISICTIQRAFLLVYFEKAELISKINGSLLRTVNRSFPMPAVIKLRNYVNIPYKGVVLTRQNVFKRDGFECQYCGTKKDLTLDHVIPKAKGGKSTWINLITACKKCNTQKGDYSPEEIGFSLRNSPYKPNYILFLRDFSGYAHDEWIPYLKTGTNN